MTPQPNGKSVDFAMRWPWVLAVWWAVAIGAAAGGCTAMSGSYWGPSGGGFVRVFGDAGPAKSHEPATVSEWMAQPRPQP